MGEGGSIGNGMSRACPAGCPVMSRHPPPPLAPGGTGLIGRAWRLPSKAPRSTFVVVLKQGMVAAAVQHWATSQPQLEVATVALAELHGSIP